MWINSATMAQAHSNAWVPIAPAPLIHGKGSKSTGSKSSKKSTQPLLVPRPGSPTKDSNTPSTPKNKKSEHIELGPFTPAAAIFISPGPDMNGTPVTAILRPNGSYLPTPLFAPPIMRHRPVNPSEDVDPSTIFKLPNPPYSTNKPPYSYAALIGQALNAARRGRACLDHIYLYISTVYPYYKRGEQAWQNSIRHNLSQNSSFTRLKHPSGGQHGEWGIRPEDLHCFKGGGFVRSGRVEVGRKRRRKGAFDDDTDLEEDVSARKKVKRSPVPSSSAGDDITLPPLSPTTSSQDRELSPDLVSQTDVVAQAKLIAQNRAKSRKKAVGWQGHRRRGFRNKALTDSEESEEDYESEFEEEITMEVSPGKRNMLMEAASYVQDHPDGERAGTPSSQEDDTLHPSSPLQHKSTLSNSNSNQSLMSRNMPDGMDKHTGDNRHATSPSSYRQSDTRVRHTFQPCCVLTLYFDSVLHDSGLFRRRRYSICHL